jgi:hypothetical protein
MNDMSEAPRQEDGTREPMPEGVYFGLPEDVYHADPSLGSHDVIRLFAGAPYYWWESWMNPLRKPRDADALVWGSAFHKFVLEGEEAFQSAYAQMPQIEDYPNALKTIDDIKARMRELGIGPLTGKKEELMERLRAAAPGTLFWDDLIADALASGQTLLKPDVWREIVLSAQMIVKNPSIAKSFTGGYPEVSIFWREDGVPCKARIDYLRLLETVDLKSIVNPMQKAFDHAVRSAIANYRYDIQAAHYQVGREMARRFAEEGKVFGTEEKTPPQKWLKAFAKVRPQNEASDTANGYTWIWVFYSKTGAPIAKGYEFSSQDGAFDLALQHRLAALDRYRENLAKFGTDMWILDEPIELITGSDLPSWMAT